MRFNEVGRPRKNSPRETELEIFRAEIEFGKPKCNEVSVKFLLISFSIRSVEKLRPQSRVGAKISIENEVQ